MTSDVAIGWRPRAEPLSPVAIAGRGDAARSLVQRLLDAAEEALTPLRGVGGTSVVVVSGPAADLPWVDGVTWLGRDPQAPALLLPTSWEPSVPSALLQRALLSRDLAAPVALLREPACLVSLATARPLGREQLRAWLDGRP